MLLLEFPNSNLIFTIFNVLKDLSDRIDLAALCSDSRWKSWVRLFFTSLADVHCCLLVKFNVLCLHLSGTPLVNPVTAQRQKSAFCLTWFVRGMVMR